MAVIHPQLAALLQALQGNPNADSGQPVMGRHTVHSGAPDASGQVQGGDGARYPRTEPGTGFVPAPGENPVIGGDWLHEGEDDPRTWDPQANHQSLLGPHGTNLPGLLAGIQALVQPGVSNPRHPLTLMRQIHPGSIKSANESGGAFGVVNQDDTNRIALQQRLRSLGG